MAGLGLTASLDELIRTVDGIAPAKAAGAAMLEAHTKATARYIGADLRMHNFRGGPVDFEARVTRARAEVTLSGGTYALADKGRRQARRSRARGRMANGRRNVVRTPYGPRVSAKGSTTAGFHITERHGGESVDAGIEAAWDVVRKAW